MTKNDTQTLLELIFAEQQKTNKQFEDLIQALAAGLGREVKTVGEDKPVWRGNFRKSSTELS